MNVYDSIFDKDRAISFFSRSSVQVAVTGLKIGCIGIEGAGVGTASIGAAGGGGGGCATALCEGGASFNEAILRLSPAEERHDTTLPNDFEGGGGGGGGGGGSAEWLVASLEGRLPHLVLSLYPII